MSELTGQGRPELVCTGPASSDDVELFETADVVVTNWCGKAVRHKPHPTPTPTCNGFGYDAGPGHTVVGR